MTRRRYRIRWASIAEQDFADIVTSIADDNVTAALRIYHEIDTAIARLRSFPMKGRVVPELREHGISMYREIIVDRWRVVYRILNHDVFLFCVIDSRRNVEDVLLQRLI